MSPPEAFPWVPLLALLASLQFAGSVILVKVALGKGDSMTGTAISIGTSFLLFGLAAPFFTSLAEWGSPAVWIFAGIGLLRPSLSTLLAYEGTHRLGPTVSTTVESVSPLFAVLGGMLLLSEEVGPGTMLGTLGVVAGVMVLSARGGGPRDWSRWALLFPLVAAMIRSGAHVGARWGLMLTPNVVLSGTVAYGVSFLIALCTASLGRRMGGTRMTRGGVVWFALAGAGNAGAIFALNFALMLGQVSHVSPLIGTYPLFTLLLSLAFYRRERLGWRTVLAVLLVVPSVMLISLSHGE